MSETGWNDGKLLKDKTIVVTGCSSGIGKETARVVKALGGDVLGVDVRHDGGDGTALHDLVRVWEKRTVGEPEEEAAGTDDEHQRVANLLPGFLVVEFGLIRHS